MSGKTTDPQSAPDFSSISTLINDAIAAHKLPGAVVVIGHGGKVVFHQAYGVRKLAGEPGLDGKPSPAEPMTEDTIFDMASLTKCLATATAVMQLYEAGKLQFDDPVQKYLPEFNPSNDPQRAQVTLRMLLTHTSGEPADVNLKDPWGLAAPDKAEGIHRALTVPLQSAPAETFRYSDVNYILLGAIVEKLSGESEDEYARQHIFKPLAMNETRYLPIAKACGVNRVGAAAMLTSSQWLYTCMPGTWRADVILPRTAPTAHDDESKSNPSANPDFDHLLRGTVHDPTTRRMGGVAGHAGVFSTAHDVSLFAQALLDRLAGRPSSFPLKQSTLELMTAPEQPGHNPQQLIAANIAEHAAIAESTTTSGAPSSPQTGGNQSGAKVGLQTPGPLLAPSYPSIKGQNLRGFGWDVDTAFSKPRGMIFPIGSFGHTGFTGTSLWMDPGSDTYVILLANAIHPRGNPPISNLRGEVATAATRALHLYMTNGGGPSFAPSAKDGVSNEARQISSTNLATRHPERSGPRLLRVAQSKDPDEPESAQTAEPFSTTKPKKTPTLAGIDVLESTHFAALTSLAKQHNDLLRLGLLTNQSGLDSEGHRTVDILHSITTDNVQLKTLFSPEHGIFGKQATEHISAETDPATGLHVTSLYGPHDSDKRPSHEQLKDLDAVLIDLQDAGVHFWTYESVLGYFLEASAKEQADFHHRLDIIVLDRPNPIDGTDVQGPLVDSDRTSYVAYMPLPVRHGLTYGELARYINGEKRLNAPLTVIAMQHWQRADYFADTGLKWTNPSPNLRSPDANILYPALGLIEFSNISVGRGTDAPFSFFGAGVPPPDKNGQYPPPWFSAAEVVEYLNSRHIPGVEFTPALIPIAEDANKYPFHDQTIQAVKITVTDRNALDSPELGIEILSALHHLYPTHFHLASDMPLVANKATMDALAHGDDPRSIAASWKPALDHFRSTRAQYLLY